MGGKNLHEQGGISGFGQLENKVIRTAAQLFGGDLLPYIDVEGEILTVTPTEHVHLEMRRLGGDLNSTMEKGVVRHLELGSDNVTEQDLRHFRKYEAHIGMIYNAPTMITVICTSNTKVQKKELIDEDSVYRIEVVRLRGRNADKVPKKLRRRIHKDKKLRRRDAFPLLLTPLMSGDMEMSECIYQGVEFLQYEEL